MLQKNKVATFPSNVPGRINHALWTLRFQTARVWSNPSPRHFTRKKSDLCYYFTAIFSHTHAVEGFSLTDHLLQNTISRPTALLNRSPEGRKKKKRIFCLPTLALRNLFPILWSVPIALATSSTSAPVASHRALIELMLLILWARKALAACK